MARCFPYPPPGFVGRSTADEALIGSIKLQRDKSKADRKEKKDKKKEKKEKKREKKEKREKEKSKNKLSEIVDADVNDKGGQKGKRSPVNSKGDHSQKIREDETELLEKSDLTQELELPFYSHNSCYSTDSTQNSNKRKRHDSPSIGSSNHGSGIRIRLPLSKKQEPESSLSCSIPKHKEPETSSSNGKSCPTRMQLSKHKEPKASRSSEQNCSIHPLLPKYKEPEALLSEEQRCSTWLPLPKGKSPGASLPIDQSCSIPKCKEPLASFSNKQSCPTRLPLPKQKNASLLFSKDQSSSILTVKEPVASPSKEQSCSTSGRVDSLVQRKYEISGLLIQDQSFMIVDTVGQGRSTENVDANKELRSSKSKKHKAELRYKALLEDWQPMPLEAEQTDSGDQDWLFEKHEDRQENKRHKTIDYELSWGGWPRAQYIQEMDVYALPYTVPF